MPETGQREFILTAEPPKGKRGGQGRIKRLRFRVPNSSYYLRTSTPEGTLYDILYGMVIRGETIFPHKLAQSLRKKYPTHFPALSRNAVKYCLKRLGTFMGRDLRVKPVPREAKPQKKPEKFTATARDVDGKVYEVPLPSGYFSYYKRTKITPAEETLYDIILGMMVRGEEIILDSLASELRTKYPETCRNLDFGTVKYCLNKLAQAAKINFKYSYSGRRPGSRRPKGGITRPVRQRRG
jgi:hypothetical protein